MTNEIAHWTKYHSSSQLLASIREDLEMLVSLETATLEAVDALKERIATGSLNQTLYKTP